MLNGHVDRDRARSALHAIDAGCDRQTWVKVLMGAKAAGLTLDEFDAWSANGGNYAGTKDVASVWRGINGDGGVTPASLFSVARDAGWRDEKPQHNHQGNGGQRDNRAPRHQSRRVDAPGTGQKGRQRVALDPATIWASCEPAMPEHGYIRRKLGLPDGLRVVPADARLNIAGSPMAGWLAVPAADAAGTLHTLQFIPPDQGKKLNLPGCAVAGWHVVGPALADGARVFVCEGIGQAWSAHQASRASAVVAFGAGRMEAVSRALLERWPGLRLVLVGDVGKESQCERIARDLRCGWTVPPADRGSNADVNDMHQRDGLEAVAALLERAQQPAQRFRLMTADELAALPPVRWRVRGVLPTEGLAAIFGPSGSGKSFLTLDMLGAITEGRDWFGHRATPCAVVYVALEGEAGIAQRVNAYRARQGQAPAGMRFIAQPFALLESGDVAELAHAIRDAGGAGGVVAIDTLNRAASGADENDSRDMGAIIAGAKLLQAALGGLVLLVHHSGKDATKGLRGHSSLHAALDAVIEVTRDGDRREWRTSKSKDGADGEPHPFRLDVVELGDDNHGEAVTSCVVASEEAPGDAIKRATVPGGGNMRVAFDRIGELLRAAGDSRPDGAPDELPPGRPAIALEAAIDAVAARLVCDPKRKRERSTQAIQGLCGRGLLRHEAGFVWCA